MRQTVLAASAPAAAIVVFGVIYGTLARPELGATATMLSSLLIFSGSVQFTIAALLTSGAGTAALVTGATTLNMRNLVLGAVLRPRIRQGPLRRGAMAWFLTDEAVGLALTSGAEASSVLLVSGSMFYASWQLGTILGLAGASLESMRQAAGAVFPVLFVGLAAGACPSLSIALRALAAASATGLAAWMWPGSQGIVAVTVAIAVSLIGRAR